MPTYKNNGDGTYQKTMPSTEQIFPGAQKDKALVHKQRIADANAAIEAIKADLQQAASLGVTGADEALAAIQQAS